MSRQLLADSEWPNKVAAEQIKDIHRCVRCNKKYLSDLQQHQSTHQFAFVNKPKTARGEFSQFWSI
jgi:hypothetical protein